MYRDQRRVGRRDHNDYDDEDDHIRELERQIEEKRRMKLEQEREERRQLEEYYSKPNDFAVGERDKRSKREQQRSGRRVHPVLGKPPTPVEKKRGFKQRSSENLTDRERRHQERMRAFYNKKQNEIAGTSSPYGRKKSPSNYRSNSPDTVEPEINDKKSLRERKWEEKRRRRMAKKQQIREPSPPSPQYESPDYSNEYSQASFQDRRPEPEQYETQRDRAFREKRERFLREKERKMGLRNDTEEEYQQQSQDNSIYDFDQSPDPSASNPYFGSPSHRRQSFPSPARNLMNNIGEHDEKRRNRKPFDHGVPNKKDKSKDASEDYSFFDKIGSNKKKSYFSHDIPKKDREPTPKISGPSLFDKIGERKRKGYFNHDIPQVASKRGHPQIVTPEQGAGLFDKLGAGNQHKKPFDHSIPKSPYKEAERKLDSHGGGVFDKLGSGNNRRKFFSHDIPSPSRRNSEPERRIPSNGKGLFDNLGEHDRYRRNQNKFDHAIPKGAASPKRHDREMNDGFGGKGVLDDLGHNEDYRRKNYEKNTYQHHVPPAGGYDAKRKLASANENAGNFLSGIGAADDRYQRRVAAQQENLALLSKFNNPNAQSPQRHHQQHDMHSPSNKVEKITNWNQGISSDQAAAQKRRRLDYAAELRAQMAEKEAKKRAEQDKRKREDEEWEKKYGWQKQQQQQQQQQQRQAQQQQHRPPQQRETPAQPSFNKGPSNRPDYSTEPPRRTPTLDENAPRSLKYAEPNAVAEKQERLAKQRELREALEKQRAEAEAKKEAEKRRKLEEEKRDQEKLDAYYAKMKEDQEREREQKKAQQQQLQNNLERQKAVKKAREQEAKQMSLEAQGAHLPNSNDSFKPSNRPRASLISEQQPPRKRESFSRQSVHTSDIHSDLTPSLPPDTPPVHNRRGRRESIAPEDRPTTSGSSRAIQDELDKLKDEYRHDNEHLKEELERRLRIFKEELRQDTKQTEFGIERANHGAFDREMNAQLKSRNPQTNRMLKNIVMQESMDNKDMKKMNGQMELDQSLGGESHFVIINAARPMSSHRPDPSMDFSVRPDTATSDVSIASSALPKPVRDRQLERLEKENEFRLRHLNDMLTVENDDDKRNMLSDYLNNNKIELLPDPLGDDDYKPSRRPTSGTSMASSSASSKRRRRRRKHKMVQPPHQAMQPQASIPSQRAFIDPNASYNPLDDD